MTAHEEIQARIAAHVYCNDKCGPEMVTVWWCPQRRALVRCEGPCPDGTPHQPAPDEPTWMHYVE